MVTRVTLVLCLWTGQLKNKSLYFVCLLTANIRHSLYKGVFGPMKRAWREECHTYLLNNPGKVVSRYQCSSLFEQTWMREMTPQNITSGFKVTGIYPTDRYRLLPKIPHHPPTLCERTGLEFILLFTPLCHSICSLTPTSYSCKIPIHYDDSLQGDESMSANSTDDSLPSEPSVQSSTLLCPVFENSCLHVPFTQEEVIRFKKCKEEGYDITTDGRYNNKWRMSSGTQWKTKEIRKAERERKKEEKMKELEKHKELKKAKETSKFNIT